MCVINVSLSSFFLLHSTENEFIRLLERFWPVSVQYLWSIHFIHGGRMGEDDKSATN